MDNSQEITAGVYALDSIAASGNQDRQVGEHRQAESKRRQRFCFNSWPRHDKSNLLFLAPMYDKPGCVYCLLFSLCTVI